MMITILLKLMAVAIMMVSMGILLNGLGEVSQQGLVINKVYRNSMVIDQHNRGGT
jgi:hypothetical protein